MQYNVSKEMGAQTKALGTNAQTKAQMQSCQMLEVIILMFMYR